MALTYSYLHAAQGSDTVFTVNLVNEDSTALNLTGYSVAAKYARNPASLTKYAFAASIGSPPSGGSVTLTLTASATNAIKAGNYMYDVELTDSDGKVERTLEGLLEISPSVTT